MQSRVSVIIPSYNHTLFILDAIKSAIKQTVKPYEIIVVDDCSTDDTKTKVNDFIISHCLDLKEDDPIIIYHRHEENKGLPSARNTAVELSNGDYVLPLDADDMLEEHAIEKMSRILDRNTYIDIVYPFAKWFGTQNFIQTTDEYKFTDLLKRNFMFCCSMYRRKVWEDYNYNENMVNGYEDWDFWIGAGKNGHFGKLLSEPVFLYRKHGFSMIDKAVQCHDKLVEQIHKNHPEVFMEGGEVK